MSKKTTPQLPPPGKMFTETLLITPEIAEFFLSMNTNNRKLNDSKVRELAAEVDEGRWTITHQGAAVSTENVLLDGQHRFAARRFCKKDFPMNVTWNLPPEALKVIDLGNSIGCKRTVAQSLELLYNVPDARGVMSRCVTIRNIESPKKISQKLPVDEAYAMYVKFDKGLDFSMTDLPIQGGIGGAPFAGSMAYAFYADPIRVAAFTKQVKTGENLKRTDPAYALREFLRSNKPNSEPSRWDNVLASMRAVHAAIKQEDLTVIKVAYLREGNTMKDIFKFFAEHTKNL